MDNSYANFLIYALRLTNVFTEWMVVCKCTMLERIHGEAGVDGGCLWWSDARRRYVASIQHSSRYLHATSTVLLAHKHTRLERKRIYENMLCVCSVWSKLWTTKCVHITFVLFCFCFFFNGKFIVVQHKHKLQSTFVISVLARRHKNSCHCSQHISSSNRFVDINRPCHDGS